MDLVLGDEATSRDGGWGVLGRWIIVESPSMGERLPRGGVPCEQGGD